MHRFLQQHPAPLTKGLNLKFRQTLDTICLNIPRFMNRKPENGQRMETSCLRPINLFVAGQFGPKHTMAGRISRTRKINRANEWNIT